MLVTKTPLANMFWPVCAEAAGADPRSWSSFSSFIVYFSSPSAARRMEGAGFGEHHIRFRFTLVRTPDFFRSASDGCCLGVRFSQEHA